MTTPQGPSDGLGLDEAYAVETPDDNRRLYARWAATYESDFIARTGYRYHEHVADVFVALERPPGPTLDVGCGTGIVGRALQERGVDGIHGVDISPQMLEQASSKGVYETLIEADLTAGPLVAPRGDRRGAEGEGVIDEGLSPAALEVAAPALPRVEGAL